jgi:hypothetical protein
VRRAAVEAKERVDASGERPGRLLDFCPGAAATCIGDPLQVYPEALGRMEILDGMFRPERKSRLPILLRGAGFIAGVAIPLKNGIAPPRGKTAKPA